MFACFDKNDYTCLYCLHLGKRASERDAWAIADEKGRWWGEMWFIFLDLFTNYIGYLHVCRLPQRSSSWWTRLMFELASHVRRRVHFFASYVSQTKIYILLEAAEHADVLLQKDSDLVELRDANASLERKVSWFFYTNTLAVHCFNSLLSTTQVRKMKRQSEDVPWLPYVCMSFLCLFVSLLFTCFYFVCMFSCLHVSLLLACFHVCMFAAYIWMNLCALILGRASCVGSGEAKDA